MTTNLYGEILKAVNCAGNSIMVIEADGSISWVDNEFENLWSCSLSRFRKIVGNNVFASRWNQGMAEALESCFQTREPGSFILLWLPDENTRKYIKTTLTPIIGPEGSALRIIALSNDITSYKEAEDTLYDKQDNLLTTMDYLEQANNMLEQQRQEIEQQRQSLEQEKAKADKLLLNVLPFEIAHQLSKKGYVTPKKFKKVSVMFADFVGFSQVALSYDIKEFIHALGFYFEKFDNITSSRFIEKIKTIGDCYMCVGGIPRKNNSHAFDTVIAALEIQQLVEQVADECQQPALPIWRLRIGIHTGSVIAGVIGKKKFAYDVWGDTVNVASRMEASGRAGMVNISQTTYERIKDFFKCFYRGKIPIKGLGEVNMYFVERILPEYSEDDCGIVPNAKFRKYLASL